MSYNNLSGKRNNLINRDTFYRIRHNLEAFLVFSTSCRLQTTNRPSGLAFSDNVCYTMSIVNKYAIIMLTARKKATAIKNVQIHTTDTGSPEVQVSLLSKKITELTNHLKEHKKDNHSRRGLIQMVADRRTHLKYLERTNKKRYTQLVTKLGLK